MEIMKNMNYYIFLFVILVFSSYVGKMAKKQLDAYDTDDYELIQKYLLNDNNPLQGKNKPKLWIHTKYEINARQWSSYGTRNSKELNQPYLYLTIQSVVVNCGDDFNICLIDDKSFHKLIPDWRGGEDISILAEPLQTHVRQLGMLQLLYIYGGLIVPNSFICLRPLLPLFEKCANSPVMFEKYNRTCDIRQHQKPVFVPDMFFMGATKHSDCIQEMMSAYGKIHPLYAEGDFTGEMTKWCISAVEEGKIQMMDGNQIGTKNNRNQPILLDDLMEEEFLKLNWRENYGIYIPADEILTRPKYQWFVQLTKEDAMRTTSVLSKYLVEASIGGTTTQQNGVAADKKNIVKSVTLI